MFCSCCVFALLDFHRTETEAAFRRPSSLMYLCQQDHVGYVTQVCVQWDNLSRQPVLVQERSRLLGVVSFLLCLESSSEAIHK